MESTRLTAGSTSAYERLAPKLDQTASPEGITEISGASGSSDALESDYFSVKQDVFSYVLNQDQVTFLQALKQAYRLLDPQDTYTIFKDRALDSSQPAAVIGKADSFTHLRSYSLQVEAISQYHHLRSNALQSGQSVTLPEGQYSFSITDGHGLTESLEIDLKPEDTFLTIFQSLSVAIDQTDLAVESNLIAPTPGRVALQLKSTILGSAGRIELKDIQGNLLDYAGLNTDRFSDGHSGGVIADATDTVYTIDGQTKKTDQHHVDVPGFPLGLRFFKPTSGQATLSVVPDFDTMINKLDKIVEMTNRAMEHFMALGTPESDAIYGALAGVTTQFSAELNDLGIDVEQNGFMSIRGDELSQNLRQKFDLIKSRWAAGGGFPDHMLKILDQQLAIQNAPTQDRTQSDAILRQNIYSPDGAFLPQNHLIMSYGV